MEEIFKIIKEYPDFAVSNKGRIKNIKLNTFKQYTIMNGLCYVSLTKDNKNTMRAVHKLVAKTFGKMSKNDDTAYHINYVRFDNRDKNLEGCKIGEAIARTRKHNRYKKNKQKGIYKWNKGNCKWRAILSLSDNNMSTKLIGYFKTRKEAKIAYYNAYKQQFNVEPFRL
jgi:hypothetical protein